MFGHNDLDRKSFTWFMPYLRHSCPKLMNPKFWFTTSSSCSDVMSGFFLFYLCAILVSLSQLHPSSHIMSASVLLFLHHQPLYYMLYCPNPSCTRNLRNTKKPFPSDKSFSNHVQQSPQCKPFVFDQTAVSAPTMQAPLKQASTNTTAHSCLRNSGYS